MFKAGLTEHWCLQNCIRANNTTVKHHKYTKHSYAGCVSDLYLLLSTGIKSMRRTYSAEGSIPEIRTWNVGNIRLQVNKQILVRGSAGRQIGNIQDMMFSRSMHKCEDSHHLPALVTIISVPSWSNCCQSACISSWTLTPLIWGHFVFDSDPSSAQQGRDRSQLWDSWRPEEKREYNSVHICWNRFCPWALMR